MTQQGGAGIVEVNVEVHEVGILERKEYEGSVGTREGNEASEGNE